VGWSDSDLMAALDRYEAELIAHDLQPLAVQTYVVQGRRFLQWRVGDYQPRGSAEAPHSPPLQPVESEDLAADLAAYRTVLERAGLQPPTVHTYIDQSARFLHWLDGTYLPGGPARPADGRRATVPTGGADQAWTWEGAVQDATVAWLRSAGWAIERLADTRSREHGPDIIASLGSRRLAIEVKGYPQATYAQGEKLGQRRRWPPAAQARHYFGSAVHMALAMRDAMPGTEIAIALPDVGGNRALVDQVSHSLVDLAIRVFLIGATGAVLELPLRGISLSARAVKVALPSRP
jgi:hypothetical protein